MPSGHYKRKPMSENTKLKLSIAHKGKKMPIESRLKIGLAKRKYSYDNSKICKNCGNIFFKTDKFWGLNWVKKTYCSRKCKTEKLGVWNKGKKLPERSGKNHHNFGKPLNDKLKVIFSNINKSRIGEKHHRWIKNRTKLKKDNRRNDSAYKEWRINVYKRDDFVCKLENKDCKGRIEAHHILGWAEYPELRYDINNGITLCHFHHPRKRADEIANINKFNNLINK